MMKYFILLCFLPGFALAQKKETKFISRFSIEMGAGKVSSFMNSIEYLNYPPINIDCIPCPVVFFTPFSNVNALPTTGNYRSFLLNFQISKRHQLGIGRIFSQHGYHRLTYDAQNVLQSTTNFLYDYKGFRLRHRMNLLMGEKLVLGLANSCELERLSNGGYDYSLYKYGISHIAEIIVGCPIGKHVEIDLNIIGKTALTEYSPSAWAGKFNRFGAGATLGVSFRI